MTHNTQNISGYHSGDSLRINVDVEDEDGNVIDIRGVDLTYAIAQSSGSIVVEKTVTDGGISITDGVNGKAVIEIEPGDTAGLSGTYQHELELVDTNGDVTTLWTGTITISEDIIT